MAHLRDIGECLRISVSPAKKERGREREKETKERVTQCDFIFQISIS
ncbi:hypothetical protein GBAR_LOCUS19468 [Geodia barretti]|uniref:Uncharacterized protein n=1 Tax=Geodia barretti TaxID=519541 RepID=A0AA35SS10_GEOBA|nr:hypothetical protein GBAR_LOCUS19468 [Geodia barretti]